MMTSNLRFPSGLTIERAKKRAKQLVKDGIANNTTSALDSISIVEVGLPWAKAMEHLRQSPAQTSGITLFMSKQDIQDVMKEVPQLTQFGYGSYRDGHQTYQEYLARVEKDKASLREAVDECNKACMYLQFLEKRKTINVTGQSSYGLKHEAERYLRRLGTVENKYVSNGAFICAAHFMGFDHKPTGFNKPNALFNYSKRSPIIQWSNLTSGTHMHSGKRLSITELESMLGLA